MQLFSFSPVQHAYLVDICYSVGYVHIFLTFLSLENAVCIFSPLLLIKKLLRDLTISLPGKYGCFANKKKRYRACQIIKPNVFRVKTEPFLSLSHIFMKHQWLKHTKEVIISPYTVYLVVAKTKGI